MPPDLGDERYGPRRVLRLVGRGLQRSATAVDRFEAFRGVAVVGRHFFTPRALIGAGHRPPAGGPGFLNALFVNPKINIKELSS